MMAMFERSIRLLHISRVKPLGAPAIPLRQELAGGGAPALTLPQPTQAQRGTEFSRLGLRSGRSCTRPGGGVRGPCMFPHHPYARAMYHIRSTSLCISSIRWPSLCWAQRAGLEDLTLRERLHRRGWHDDYRNGLPYRVEYF
jgi:hypothetical protein